MMRKLIPVELIAIILCTFLSFYQVDVEKEYAQGFYNNVGELNNYINPVEKSRLYELYKEIFIIEEQRLEDGISDRSVREERLKLEFNEKLNKLTKKYKDRLLMENNMEEVEEIDDLEIDDLENVYEEKGTLSEQYGEKVINDLKNYVSKDDYESIISMKERFEYGEDFDFQCDMKNILKKYTDLDSDMIINQIVQPSELKGVFKINEDFSISYKPIKVLTPEKPSDEVIEEANEIWKKVNEILPKSQMKYFEDFILFSDGQYDTLAYVNIVEDNLSKYDLGIDYKDVESGRDDFDVTVIHEFGHVLTTNGEEVEYTENVDPNYYYEDGYLSAKENSYLNEFYIRYWADIYEDLLMAERLEDSEEAKNYFYLRHLNDFASGYCSTSPVEDIAESFALFVLEDKPKGNSLPEQKIRFFYEFNEFIEIRKEIRENLKIS
ncbi:hypothetical protein [Clostridium sp. UBA1056]|uniref:hypothetical protein n=1 Tax=unclassified Clostridium TaxID=2614128 RepID=UPI003216233A